jgi:hypothetical protein
LVALLGAVSGLRGVGGLDGLGRILSVTPIRFPKSL